MTTKPTTEYVTDVEHNIDCRSIDDRKALVLIRSISQSHPADFDKTDGVSMIYAPDDRNWEFEETLEPLRLCCTSCGAERYVAQDWNEDIIALTPENCSRAYASGHYPNYDRKPCEYCGFTGRAS